MQKIIKIFKSPTATNICFRTKYLKFDMSYGTTHHFLQFGKDPVKFVCITKNKHPIFLRSIGWKIKKTFKSIVIGTTTRPINYPKLFKKSDKNFLEKVNAKKSELRCRSRI